MVVTLFKPFITCKMIIHELRYIIIRWRYYSMFLCSKLQSKHMVVWSIADFKWNNRRSTSDVPTICKTSQNIHRIVFTNACL